MWQTIPGLRVLGPSRRELLRLGGVAGLGLALPDRVAAVAPGFGRAKSVVFLFASGGQSQFETWDPKPDAPVEIRGAFGSIATATPGLRVCEHLPRLARLSQKYAVVRNFSHDDFDHGSASYWTLTGKPHARKSSNPSPTPADVPTLGAALHRLRPARHLPATAATLNGPLLVPELPAPGQDAGLLGRANSPLVVGDPRDELFPAEPLPAIRLARRGDLLSSLEDHLRRADLERERDDARRLYAQAAALLADPLARRAFDLNAEPDALRTRYGRDRMGQSCLLARRLVEAGLPLVTVFLSHSARGQDKYPDEADEYGWDTHNDIFVALREQLLPRFDRAVSAFLDDLDQRGLLATTLVVCVGEFGRAPRVALEKTFLGSAPGRKHWGGVYSGIITGAGIASGAIFGGSDRQGGSPSGVPVNPSDLAATIWHALGIDPHAEYHDSTGRPHALCTGQPVTAWFR